MKVIWFRGALGNQVFDYALYLYLLKNTNEKKIYGYYRQRFPILVDKYFDIKLPPSTFLTNLVSFFAFRIFRILRLLTKNIPFCSTDNNFKIKSTFYDGYWQKKIFYDHKIEWIKFKDIELDEINKKIIEQMNSTESIAVHVRRGDYLKLSEKNGLTSLDYYNNAISILKNKFTKPVFYFFSDDIEWVKMNIKCENSVYLTWNTGNKSFIDMYLMTFCKANILANSTFSYWGAYLNKNNPYVIYPKVWSLDGYVKSEDLVLDNWIGL